MGWALSKFILDFWNFLTLQNPLACSKDAVHFETIIPGKPSCQVIHNVAPAILPQHLDS